MPVGEYNFEIIGAENKRFSTGSDGIALKVGVHTDTGAVRFVNDNLVFTDKAMFKVSQFCKCVGLVTQYEAGELDAEDCKGRVGKLRISVEPEGEYPAKNKVAGYIVPKSGPAAQVATSASSPPPEPPNPPAEEDDIPF